MTSATRDPVSHSFALLEAINRDGSKLNLTQLAAEIGVHKSSASRLLTTLVEAGYAARDPQTARYVLGPKLVTLAVSILQHHGITPLSQTILDDLALASGETVTLSLWNHDHAVDIAMSPGRKAVQYMPQLSLRNPAHCSATGRLFLANLPAAEVDRILSGPLPSFTAHTVTDPARIRAALDTIRREGVAWNDEEFEEGICSLAAPVRRDHGLLAAVVAVSIPKFRFEPSRTGELIALLKAAAGRLGPKANA